jgi:DNA-binding transcriptional LysR family regulator
MLTIDLLRVFVAVAETGGFTRAATLLHRSQSAVSMQIKRLEEILGTQIFDRDRTSIRLNAEGEIFIDYARRILRLVDEGISKLKTKKLVTILRLGCIEDYAARVLPPILAEFWSLHPEIYIEVGTGETSELLARLGSDYDLVLAMHPPGSGEGRLVCVDQLVWVTSYTHSPHEIVPLPVALRPEGCMEREWAIQALESAGREWRSAYVSGAIGTLYTAVEQGLVVGLFKEATISGKLRRLGAAENFPPLPQAEIALHMADDRISTPALMLLVENLAECLRKSERPGSLPRN